MPPLLLRAALLWGSIALIQPPHPLVAQKPRRLPIDIPYRRFVLPNGLTLIVHEDHKAPIVAVNVWYHVGSKNERPGRTGFAHLFEHLMFNGSENYDKDFFGPLEQAGATDMNGTTNEDRTNYFENVPTTALDLALWMESDRMGHLVGAISQAKLDEQRGVVQNEKRQGENEPYGKVWDFLTPKLYPANHPYSWTTIGSMDDLDAAKLRRREGLVPDLLRRGQRRARRRGRHRRADRQSRRSSSTSATSRRVRRWLGSRPGSPSGPAASAGVMQDRVPQARIYKVWNVPGWGTRRRRLSRPAGRRAEQRQVVAALQAAGLRRADRNRRFGRIVDLREIGGLFVVEATARPGVELAKVERAVDEELARLLAGGPTAAELQPGQDAIPGRLHPRRRADRRIRRQVRRAGAGRGVRRPARFLQGAG